MRTTPRLLAWLLLGLTGLYQSAQAGSGGVNTLPSPGTLSTSGVQVVVDSRWVDSNGYRPVRVTILPLKTPAVADETYRVIIKPQSYYGGSRDLISQIIELKQGDMQASATVPVPQDMPWHAIVVDVHRDGRKLEDLSGDQLSWPRGGYWNANETIPNILAIHSNAPTLSQREALVQVLQGQGEAAAKKLFDKPLPDIRNLIRSFPDNQFSGNFVSQQQSDKDYDLSTFVELRDNGKAELLHPDEIPERWIEYSSIDVVLISLPDLVDLAKKRPKVVRALADWARAGQTLIVYEVGDNFSGLQQLEQLLQLPPRPKAETEKFRGWREPSKRGRGDKLRTLADNNNYPRRVYSAPGGATTTTTLEVQQPGEGDIDDSWPFVLRPASLGNVIAFSGNPFPGAERDWDWALNSLPGNNWNPSQRLGVSQQARNEDFWNFLIPGTGQAPVLSFLVFITLFVVLIGPVNYYFLAARRRLYMLLVTVPVGAFLVTLGLFVYAMFTDGLGVKSRFRSYTSIDQRNGFAVSTSRQAYYASIAPSRGLVYDDATAVVPFLHEPTTRHGSRAVRRVVNWVDDEQHLRAGYLSSRSLTQLLITKSAPTKARLRVGAAKGDRLPITNELDTTLAYLLVKDADGKHYAGTNIKPGAAELALIEPGAAATDLSKRLHEARPAFPDGYDERMHDSQMDVFAFGPRYYNRWGNNQSTQANSLLERKLARFGHLGSQPLEPRSYVAFCSTNPLVPAGANGTRQYSSLHVIEGNY